MQVSSTVKLNMPRIKQLTQAAVTALELTGEALSRLRYSHLIPVIYRKMQPLWITAGQMTAW
mgnify:CR=1 FL=1